MITISTLQGFKDKPALEALMELAALVEPRDFQKNHSPRPEKDRPVGTVSEQTARLCALPRILRKIRTQKPPISEADDRLVCEFAAAVSEVRDLSIALDCLRAGSRLRAAEELRICTDGVIVAVEVK